MNKICQIIQYYSIKIHCNVRNRKMKTSRKKRSKVWDSFTLHDTHACCTLCGQTVSCQNGTTPMLNHLKSHERTPFVVFPDNPYLKNNCDVTRERGSSVLATCFSGRPFSEKMEQDSPSSERLDKSLNKEQDSPSSERLDKSLNKEQDSPSSERLDKSLTREQDSSSSERLDKSLTREQDSSSSERLDKSLTREQDSPSSERLDKSLTREQDSPSSERLDKSLSREQDSPSSDRLDKSLTREQDFTSSERCDKSLTREQDSPSSEKLDKSLSMEQDSEKFKETYLTEWLDKYNKAKFEKVVSELKQVNIDLKETERQLKRANKVLVKKNKYMKITKRYKSKCQRLKIANVALTKNTVELTSLLKNNTGEQSIQNSFDTHSKAKELTAIESQSKEKGNPYKRKLRKLCVDLHNSNKIPLREVSSVLKKILNSVGLELDHYPSTECITNFLLEYSVLDLAVTGRNLQVDNSFSSLNQDGSTLDTGGVRHFNVITAEKTTVNEPDSITYQLGFTGMSGGTAKDYASTVSQRVSDIKTCCEKLDALPIQAKDASTADKSFLKDKFVTTKSDRCAVNPATTRQLKEEGVINTAAIENFCTGHPLFEVSTAILQELSKAEKDDCNYESNKTLFKRRNESDYETLCRAITKLITKDSHASVVISDLKQNKISFSSMWGRDVGSRMNQIFIRSEILLVYGKELLKIIESRIPPSQRSIILGSSSNKQGGSLSGGIEIGLKSDMTKNLAVVGTIINQSFTSPLRNVSALNIFEHAKQVKEGISKIDQMMAEPSSFEKLVLDPTPLFSIHSQEAQTDDQRKQDHISHDVIVENLKNQINECNQDFVIGTVKKAFIAGVKKLKAQLPDEINGDMNEANLKDQLIDEGLTENMAEQWVDHIKKKKSSNMGIESSVGQAKYLIKKVPGMKMYTMDARTRLKMNKTLNSDECGDIENNVPSKVLRKFGREFKKEMIKREKVLISEIIEHAASSVLFEHENNEQKLYKKAQMIKENAIYKAKHVKAEIEFIQSKNKRYISKMELFIKKQLTLRSTILNQNRVYFTKDKKKVPTEALLQHLYKQCDETLSSETNFILELMGPNDDVLVGKEYEESGFLENGSRFVKRSIASPEDAQNKHLIIAKWSSGTLKFIN